MHKDPEERLRAALETLPDEMRRCFLLHFGQGFEEEEIAILLRMPVEKVRSCLRQAGARLQPWGPLPGRDGRRGGAS
jgi:DNA-directed RNA polymerase specialized sigma24 family protein